MSAYVALQRVGDRLEQGQVVEYWKSAPHLLNFMDRSTYRLKEKFTDSLAKPDLSAELAEELATAQSALLPWKQVRSYRSVDPANARIRALQQDCLSLDQWKLLWLPPSLPYYPLGDAFERVRRSGFTKRLVFSTWNVVPKAVAALTSYEVEGRIFTEAEPNPVNSPEARRRRRGLLRFSRAEGRLTGMPVLALMYPCVTLATIGDPLEALRRKSSSSEIPLNELPADVAERVSPLVEKLTSWPNPPSLVDPSGEAARGPGRARRAEGGAAHGRPGRSHGSGHLDRRGEAGVDRRGDPGSQGSF